jgi:hypothetical protein
MVNQPPILSSNPLASKSKQGGGRHRRLTPPRQFRCSRRGRITLAMGQDEFGVFFT